MKALSLFSGIGGIDLACEWAGIETVAFCEREPFPQKVLRKHWPDVPIYDDVCTLTKERLDEDGIGPIDLIHGGYPCQPFSTAGKREGENDDRHLWPEVRRLLKAIRPRWFVGENVAGHVSLGLDEVLSDLGDDGYTAKAFVIPACAVGAFHKRSRVFIVAHLNGVRVEGSSAESLLGKPRIPYRQAQPSFQDAERRHDTFESRLCRSLHGLPDGVDRVKALGNAVVPAQIYPILAAVKHLDDMLFARSAIVATESPRA
ncbi:DNA cytosine methyltransferase [Cohnella sp. 56]|uniref:DNA cytosine methyltransferase n=1 Tax=Cohnella sp. 56 TaxID=3113722 RepID=UPI0030E8DC2E